MKERADDDKHHKIYFAYSPLGLLPMLWGLAWIFYCYAWASMVDPALIGWSRWSEILRGMIPDVLPGVLLILVGLVFSTLCIAHATFGPSRIKPKVLSVAGIVTLVLVPLLVIGIVVLS